MIRRFLQVRADVFCLCACALVFAVEAALLAASQTGPFVSSRLLLWAIGSNGKETLTTLLIMAVLAVMLRLQPIELPGLAAFFGRGRLRHRCAILLVGQAAAFAACLAAITALVPEVARGMTEGPTAQWMINRMIWQAAADFSVLLLVLAVCDSFPGRSLRALSVPIVLTLGLLSAGLISISQILLMPHSRSATIAVVSRILPLLSDQVLYDPVQRLIGTSSYAVILGAKCSGIESITLMLACSCLFLVVFRERLRFPAALVILPAGVAAMWLANVTRVLALIWIGSRISDDLATHMFHTSAGWLLFDFIAAGLIIWCMRSPLISRDLLPDLRPDAAATRYLLPLLSAIFLNYLAPRAAGPDPFIYLRVAVVGAALWFCWRGRGGELLQRPSAGAVAIGIAVFAVWVAATGTGSVVGNRTISEGLSELSPAWRASWLLVRAAATIVTAPLAEELAFRGYLARWLVRRDFQEVSLRSCTVFAVAASSLAFGLMHAHWAAATFAGVLFAWSAMRRGRLSDAVVSHMVANGLLVAFALLTGCWSVWFKR